jgi:phage tail sheath gpL-like
VTIAVGGNSFSAEYSGTKSASQIAADLASQINLSPLVSATVSGATITLTSRVHGLQTNYTLSASYTFDTENFSSPAFTANASGPTLTGGSD